MKSILQDRKECWVCKTIQNLHRHHCFGGANRKHSEKYGLTIYLCGYHHNLSNEGVHFNKELDLLVKQMAQKKFEEIYSHEQFMKIFKRNYL